MKTNIVMLIKDRWELTEQALTSLFSNTNREEFNLTIIDDGSVDRRRSDDLVISLEPATNTAMLRVANSAGVTGRVRNLGVYWSEKTFGRGEWLYLSDNDVFFTKGWLETLTDALSIGEEKESYKLLGGSNHPYHGTNSTFNLYGKEIHEHYAVAGYSQLMRWDTWDKYGPLDANATGVRRGEDHEFCQRIRNDGGKVGSLWPEVVYATGLTDTFGQPSPGIDVLRRYKGILQQ